MTAEERAIWQAVYAAAIGGALAGPRGHFYAGPHDRPAMDANTHLDYVSRAARTYASQAVLDYRRACT